MKHYRNTPHLFIPLQNSCYPAADERPIGGNKWAILPQPHFSPFARFHPRSLRRGGWLEIDLSLHEGEGRLQQVSSSLIALLLLSLLGLKGSYNYCPIHDGRECTESCTASILSFHRECQTQADSIDRSQFRSHCPRSLLSLQKDMKSL